MTYLGENGSMKGLKDLKIIFSAALVKKWDFLHSKASNDTNSWFVAQNVHTMSTPYDHQSAAVP